MSVRAVEFRGDNRPDRDEPARPEIDRGAEAMQRLRNPFDLDLRTTVSVTRG